MTNSPNDQTVMKPPRAQVGPVAWLRENLFSSIPNTILTVVGMFLLYWILKGLVTFAVLEATWVASDGAGCAKNDGACWPFIFAKFSQFMFGTYPEAERWRPKLVYLLALGALVPLMANGMGEKRKVLFWLIAVSAVLVILRYAFEFTGSAFTGFTEMVDPVFLVLACVFAAIGALLEERTGKTVFAIFFFVIYPLIAWLLLSGGVPGLPFVPTNLWGGMLVTLVVATVGIVAAFPLGIALALGRRSQMPIIRTFSVGFIEFVRGVPLITILFMSSVMLPLFLPPGWNFDKLLRALIMVALFSAAYLAEVIRGGLQAIPRGQFEAADALGLNYRQKMSMIVLPQALKLVIPGIVNSFIGLFKDTSLVLIIGLFDLLGVVRQNMTDSKWYAPTTVLTGYLFAGFLFWLFCFGMSRYSQNVERRLAAGDRR
ncbi:MAG TPA: amino acid ABC transporter permease [Hyphomicrobiaceae bacterium]|nr:amino acid ABC transporter permease [Hyphomicrobiaceae bacterium]